MSQKTVEIAVNGFVNLGALLTAAGYLGQYNASSLLIVSANAEPVYVHLTDNGNVSPAVGIKGVPVGNAAPSKEFRFQQEMPEQFLDLGTTWLYSGAPVFVIVTVLAAGI